MYQNVKKPRRWLIGTLFSAQVYFKNTLKQGITQYCNDNAGPDNELFYNVSVDRSSSQMSRSRNNATVTC